MPPAPGPEEDGEDWMMMGHDEDDDAHEMQEIDEDELDNIDYD